MNNKLKQKAGFTLVELLVVMSIIGVLVTLVAGGFRTAQLRGRDAQRKSDLKNIANSLELFLSDYGQYPADQGGLILACPYLSGTSTACSWGASEFTDNRSIYFKLVPADPDPDLDYIYRIVPGSNNKKFQLFARLENPRDQNCLDGDCENSPVSYTCGSEVCNFSITSANSTPTE